MAIGMMGATKLAPTIGSVMPDSPALQAGVLKNDKIKQINGVEITTWNDLSSAIKESEGALIFIIEREGTLKQFTIQPQIRALKNMFGEMKQKRAVGISPSGETIVLHFYNPIDVVQFASRETYQASKMIVQGMQKLIQGVIAPDNIGGIISIVDITAKASSIGIVALFTLTALISVNLGVLNLLPIPALDGGHIMFNLYEILFKREPSEKAFYYLTIMGWALLLGLMSLGVYNDINRLVQG